MPITPEEIEAASAKAEERSEASAKRKLLRLSEEKETKEKILRLMGDETVSASQILSTYEKINDSMKKWQELGSAVNDIFSKELNTGVGQVASNAANIGVALLSGVGAAKALGDAATDAAKGIWNWYQHTADVNKQLYNIGASLGDMGHKSKEFEGVIATVSNNFNEMPDNVRKTALLMAESGMRAADIKATLGDVVALSKLWGDLTPEQIIKTTSMYTKQFGMDTKDAHNMMVALYMTAQDLRKEVKNLDQKEWVEQTNDVAINMRRYGLELSDAIALTTTLTKLGIEQARIAEVAKGFGAIGMGSPAEGAHMVNLYKEKLAMQKKDIEHQLESKNLDEEKRKSLTEQLARINEIFEKTKTPLGALGFRQTARPEELVEMQMGAMEFITKRVARGSVEELAATKGGTEKMLGLVAMQAPYFKEQGLAGMESVMKNLSDIISRPTEDLTLAQIEIKNQLLDINGNLKPGAFVNVLKEQLRELNDTQKKVAADVSKRESMAERAAAGTLKTEEWLGSISAQIGAYFRRSLDPAARTAAQQQEIGRGTKFAESLSAKGEQVTRETLRVAGYGDDVIDEILKRAAPKMIEAQKGFYMSKELTEASTEAAKKTYEIQKFDVTEEQRLGKLYTKLSKDGLTSEEEKEFEREARNVVLERLTLIEGIKEALEKSYMGMDISFDDHTNKLIAKVKKMDSPGH